MPKSEERDILHRDKRRNHRYSSLKNERRGSNTAPPALREAGGELCFTSIPETTTLQACATANNSQGEGAQSLILSLPRYRIPEEPQNLSYDVLLYSSTTTKEWFSVMRSTATRLLSVVRPDLAKPACKL